MELAKKKRSFPMNLKMKAAEEVSLGRPVKAVARALDVAPKRVREWSQMYQKGAFDAMQKDPNFVMRERKRIRGGGRPLEDGGLEGKLVEFFKACMEDKHPLITTLLRVEALSIDKSWVVASRTQISSKQAVRGFQDFNSKQAHTTRSNTGWSEATISIRTYLESCSKVCASGNRRCGGRKLLAWRRNC